MRDTSSSPVAEVEIVKIGLSKLLNSHNRKPAFCRERYFCHRLLV
jgi:hypothetical protein